MYCITSTRRCNTFSAADGVVWFTRLGHGRLRGWYCHPTQHDSRSVGQPAEPSADIIKQSTLTMIRDLCGKGYPQFHLNWQQNKIHGLGRNATRVLVQQESRGWGAKASTSPPYVLGDRYFYWDTMLCRFTVLNTDTGRHMHMHTEDQYPIKLDKSAT